MSWLDDLPYDPIEPLLQSGHTAIEYWTRKDLLNEKVSHPQEVLWDLKIPQSILRKQNDDGSWTYPSRRSWATVDYDQIETYRQLGFLVEMFGFTKEHPGIEKAAEYIFSKQTKVGDIRGIYGSELTPNYTAALLELLIKASYDDERITRAFDWLLSYRVSDGGWALALRTQGRNLDAIYDKSQSELDKTKPYSHLITGVILRAFAAHNTYRHGKEARLAAKLLVKRFFEKDVYPDKNHTYDWTRFSFPFWQTDILSSLDIIGQIDPNLADDTKVLQAKQWFIERQEPNGLFTGHVLKDRYHDLQLWYSYAICRAFSRFR